MKNARIIIALLVLLGAASLPKRRLWCRKLRLLQQHFMKSQEEKKDW